MQDEGVRRRLQGPLVDLPPDLFQQRATVAPAPAELVAAIRVPQGDFEADRGGAAALQAGGPQHAARPGGGGQIGVAPFDERHEGLVVGFETEREPERGNLPGAQVQHVTVMRYDTYTQPVARSEALR